MPRDKQQRQQRPIKGFRPGKEPPELRKLRAREQFGEMSAAQRRLVDLLAERTPEQARGLLRRWRIMLLAGGGVLTVLAVVLAFRSIMAAAVAAFLAAILFVLWARLHRQRASFEAMADAVSGPAGRKRRGS